MHLCSLFSVDMNVDVNVIISNNCNDDVDDDDVSVDGKCHNAMFTPILY